MPNFKVTLISAASFNTPFGARWKKGNSRILPEDDPNLAYYRGKRAFNIGEVAEPKKPGNKPEAEEPVPLATSPPSVPEEPVKLPEVDELKSDEELKGFLKDALLDYATDRGLSVESAMTKAEIRAEIDTLR